jgi:sporulation protein YlmC with PRC-barrel domain
MIETSTIDAVIGATAYDSDGEQIGKVGQVYVDPDDGHAVWASVNTGLFGAIESFLPLENATWDGSDLRVPYDKAFVKDAPRIDVDGDLSTRDQEALHDYYTLGNTANVDTADYTDADLRDTVGGPGRDTSGTGRP